MVILKYYAIFNPEAGRNYSGNNLSEQPPHFAEKAIEQLLTMKKFVPFRKCNCYGLAVISSGMKK